jgi:hypothetical protein
MYGKPWKYTGNKYDRIVDLVRTRYSSGVKQRRKTGSREVKKKVKRR